MLSSFLGHVKSSSGSSRTFFGRIRVAGKIDSINPQYLQQRMDGSYCIQEKNGQANEMIFISIQQTKDVEQRRQWESRDTDSGSSSHFWFVWWRVHPDGCLVRPTHAYYRRPRENRLFVSTNETNSNKCQGCHGYCQGNVDRQSQSDNIKRQGHIVFWVCHENVKTLSSGNCRANNLGVCWKFDQGNLE